MYICSMLGRVWPILEQSGVGPAGEPVENEPEEGGLSCTPALTKLINPSWFQLPCASMDIFPV